MRGFLLGATMWVKFQPSKVYIVKSSCDEAMVNTRNLSLKGTLFLQQKAGDSSEISTAEILNLNLLTSVLQCSGGPWVKPVGLPNSVACDCKCRSLLSLFL